MNLIETLTHEVTRLDRAVEEADLAGDRTRVNYLDARRQGVLWALQQVRPAVERNATAIADLVVAYADLTTRTTLAEVNAAIAAAKADPTYDGPHATFAHAKAAQA